MPFTLSHPAAAIPLARYGLVMSALVAGSMAPDFLYFLPGIKNSDLGHTLRGLFVICLPLGLAALWFFHVVLKRPLLALLPLEHQKRLQPWAGPFHFFPAARLLRIVISLLLGALTHIGWDFVTHSELFALRPSPLRHLPVIGPFFSRFGIYILLQYGSTLLGAGLIAYWYVKWLGQSPKGELPPPVIQSHSVRWFLLVSMPLSAILYAVLQGYLKMPRPPIPWRMLPHLLHGVVITSVTLMVLLWVIYSLLWHLLAYWSSLEDRRDDFNKTESASRSLAS